ncbi:MAG: hypothetical protein A2X45_02990 [Lentisphaerae bacterium GWF2_50_93]|nr:MAG: hypothetical protein A2X45_02990 [Lentisphaerae bacterium GWF2_50_93]
MSTKKKILTAAAEEFAMRGYNGTTIRDICKRAKVNVALVNYHFRSKELLYHEMFQFLFSETEAENVFGRPWGGDFAQWKKMLRKWIEQIILEITGDNPLNRFKGMIFGREMQDPSEIFPNIYETFMKPRLSGLASHFRKVLPPRTSDDEIFIRTFSVISNCIFYFHDRVIVNMTFPGKDFTSANMNEIVDHITDAACVGIKYNEASRKRKS